MCHPVYSILLALNQLSPKTGQWGYHAKSYLDWIRGFFSMHVHYACMALYVILLTWILLLAALPIQQTALLAMMPTWLRGRFLRGQFRFFHPTEPTCCTNDGKIWRGRYISPSLYDGTWV